MTGFRPEQEGQREAPNGTMGPKKERWDKNVKTARPGGKRVFE